MSGDSAGLVPPAAIRRYRFRSRPFRSAPDEALRFATRLRQAVRSAHGLGVELGFRWESGPHPTVQLEVPGTLGNAWVQRSLDSAYPHPVWVAVDDPPVRRTTGPVWRSTLSSGVGTPFASGSIPAPWAETVWKGMRALPGGLRVFWTLRPGAVPPAAPLDSGRSHETAPSDRVRPVLISRPIRELRDRLDLRVLELSWAASVEVYGNPDLLAEGTRLTTLVSSAIRADGGRTLRWRRTRLFRPAQRSPFLMSESEVLGIFPTPVTSIPSVLATSGSGPRRWIACVGSGTEGGMLRLAAEPAEGRHLLVLGETGMGKSSLLVRLGWAAARHGSVILFDPLGETARSFLAGLAPAATERVTWLSPSDSPMVLNALPSASDGTSGPSESFDRAIGELVSALRRVRSAKYADAPFWGPRIEETLSLSLQVASTLPSGTLATALRLLDPSGHAPRGIPESARGLADELRARAEGRPEEVAGARRVLGEIVRNRWLHQLLCSPSPKWDVSRATGPDQITVLSADAASVGEPAARHLLSILLALVWSAVLARKDRDKLFLLLDEVQWYSHDAVAELVRLGRRGNVHVWMATQSLRSLPDDVREAVLTNVADFVVFRGDPEDARELCRWTPDLTPDRLLSLARAEAAFLTGKGSNVQFGHIPPLPPARDPEGALARAAERSRPFWGPEVRSEPSEGGIPDPIEPNPPSSPFDSRVMRYLRQTFRLAESAEPDTGARVFLDDLRRTVGDDSTALREAGRRLQKSGALRASGRSLRGSWWTVDRTVLARILATAEGAEGRSRRQVL